VSVEIDLSLEIKFLEGFMPKKYEQLLNSRFSDPSFMG